MLISIQYQKKSTNFIWVF